MSSCCCLSGLGFASCLVFVQRTSGNPKTRPRPRAAVMGYKYCKHSRKQKICSGQSLHFLSACTLKKTLCSLRRAPECGCVIINKMAYLCTIHPRCRIFLWISLHLIYHQFIPWNVIRRTFYYHPNSRASRGFWVFFFLSTHSKFILRTNATEFLPRSREYLDSPGWNVHSWMLKITHFTIDVTISHHSSILWSGFPWVVREVREGAVILFPHFSTRQQCWAQWWASSTRIYSHPFAGI